MQEQRNLKPRSVMVGSNPEPAAKRARSGPLYRVVVNVGGTRFETTVSTLSRCSTLAGMVEVLEEEPEHAPELFLDRDPKIFEVLLRLMRPPFVFAGLLPADNLELCAAMIAEADFVGFDPLLTHVKATSFRNTYPLTPTCQPHQLGLHRGAPSVHTLSTKRSPAGGVFLAANNAQ